MDNEEKIKALEEKNAKLEERLKKYTNGNNHIKYYENGKKRRHFVDFFIISQNRCVEVKSTWTAKQNKHTIFLKQSAGKLLGYKYELWVYNQKGEKVEFYD